jgi:putative NIF3 family GTP cyclohydrolase 1 type 2
MLKPIHAVLLAGVALPLHAQATAPSAAEIVSRIAAHAGVQPPADKTVDTFKSGDPTAPVKGVAVTMMATLDMLRAAVDRGDNFIITHEPTFYSHRDTVGVLQKENDEVLAEKQRFINDHGLVIWRFHDTPHAMAPDMIQAGVIQALGWEKYEVGGNPQVFDLPETTLRNLAKQVAGKTDATAVRIAGDPNVKVKRVALTQGFPGFIANRHAVQGHNVDALVIGEDHEWEAIEYSADAISEGKLKGLIVIGHIPSEQPAMRGIAEWIRSFVPEVPVHFIASKDILHSLQ